MSYKDYEYRSEAEAKFAKNLSSRHIKFEYERDKLIYIPKPKVYIPDFKIYRKDGSWFLVECKGYLKPTDRSKMKLVKEQNPDVDLRIIFFSANNKLNRNSKVHYWEWAEKVGYVWDEGVVPIEWLDCVCTK
uniref:Putative endonuclease I n=1 Tax=viral metagenome TaxID=1070528 RepID=A0A6M3L1D0_9ZZZZ